VTGGSGGAWAWKMTGLENLVSRNERLYHGTNSVPAGGVTLPFILVQV
jgi:tetrahydromethanopterin S-methyltransferase subunit F